MVKTFSMIGTMRAVGEFRQGAAGEFGHDLPLFRHRPRAQHAADDLLALDHHQGQVQLGLDAAGDADDHQSALVAQGVHVGGQVLGADMVEDQVDPLLGGELLDDLGEVGVLGEIVDQDRRPISLTRSILAGWAVTISLAVGSQRLGRAGSPRC